MAEIKTLSCDIETFSSADLPKCGVYKYCGSPDFEILLFGYSVNEGPVQVVDVACSEKIPSTILQALTDNSVEKWAYLSQFERVCISCWLRKNYPQYFKGYGDHEDACGNYLDPAGWKCSRIWGAYMGLPMSLKSIGAELKLTDQKMSEGEDLIRYFCKPCKPTKSNGGRTRNLPCHAPDKWATFKAYNKRDVEVELAIKQRLANFPVPDFVWDEYHLDQKINDRGIMLDMGLVENAIRIDALTKENLMTKLQDKTGLDNPNSVTQMKGWLADNGVETETLDKKAVKELLPSADEEVAEVLAYRQQLAKSSVSKYKAMEICACDDHRARGMFQFYGGSRTGRWCLTGDHEVLTLRGWVRLDKWQGGEIACWNRQTGTIAYLVAKALQYNYSGKMYIYANQISTPDHRMPVLQTDGSWQDMKVEDIGEGAGIPVVTKHMRVGVQRIVRKPTSIEFSGRVYCASTQTGYFVVRRCGKIWITGNSGKLIQLQNLAQNHMPDLDEARELVKSGNFEALQLLYDNVPNVLSELIRTAFIPKPGYKFLVADFSAIEARVLAFLAGEQWRIDLFARGGDIYCQSASEMFKVPVVKNGVNGHLRQRGKVAELACIAEGQLVLTDRGLVPIEQVKLEDKVWDGEEWVRHEGVVYRGERAVITYDGLTATSDHLVWVEGKSWPIQFGIAASCSSHLIKTGDGREAIRLGKSNFSHKKVEFHLEPLLYFNSMHWMRKNTMAGSGKSTCGKVKRMSALLQTKKNSGMVGKKIGSRKTKVHQSQGPRVQKLWGKRHKIRFSQCDRSRRISYSHVWGAPTNTGNRQDQYKRELCPGQFAFLYPRKELRQSTQMCPVKIQARVLAVCKISRHSQAFAGYESRGDNKGCGESSRQEKEELENHQCTARLYDIRNAGPHHRFTVSGHLVHNCGYGGGVGALTKMGALEMGLKEDELKPLVDAWRGASPNIVKLWWDMDSAVKAAIRDKKPSDVSLFHIYCQSGMLFIDLPSGRRLCYVKPKIETNRFGSESITYEGTNTGKWCRIESYGPKFVENCIAEGTLIITNRGLVPIQNILPADLIWDGIEYVSHEGLICKGLQQTISVSGIRMTPEHKILTEKGWVEACQADDLHWANGDSVSLMPQKVAAIVYDIRNCGPRRRFAVWHNGKAYLVSNCTQAVARDILAYAMKTLRRYYIVGSVHDELIIECPLDTKLDDICGQMSITPPWIKGLLLRADGYEAPKYYYKD